MSILNEELASRPKKKAKSRTPTPWGQVQRLVMCVVDRLKYNQCHAIAAKIAKMGYENGGAQQDLDNAKDSLYFAANIFDHKKKNT